ALRDRRQLVVQKRGAGIALLEDPPDHQRLDRSSSGGVVGLHLVTQAAEVARQVDRLARIATLHLIATAVAVQERLQARAHGFLVERVRQARKLAPEHFALEWVDLRARESYRPLFSCPDRCRHAISSSNKGRSPLACGYHSPMRRRWCSRISISIVRT